MNEILQEAVFNLEIKNLLQFENWIKNGNMDENTSTSEIEEFLATKMELERELALVTKQVIAAGRELMLPRKKQAKGG